MDLCFYSPIVELVFTLASTGRSVLIAGQPGAGKSTLLEAVRERLESSGIVVAELNGCGKERLCFDRDGTKSVSCIVGDALPLREVLEVSGPTAMVVAVRDVVTPWHDWDDPVFSAVRQKFAALVILDRTGFPWKRIALVTLW